MNSYEGGAYPIIHSGNDSFFQLLDNTCKRLWEKKVELSLKQIQELENYLIEMEQELDQFLAGQGQGE